MKRILTALTLAAFSTAAAAADLGAPTIDDVVGPKNDPWSGPYIEAGAGFTAANLEVANLATLGDNAFAGHIGGGYDMRIPDSRFVIGVLARYEISKADFKFDGFKLGDTKPSVLVGGRLGWVPRSDYMLYALAGYRWAKLDPNSGIGIGDIDTSGWVLGGGVEVLLTEHVFAGLEYNVALDAGETIEGVSVDSSDHTGKVRLGYRW